MASIENLLLLSDMLIEVDGLTNDKTGLAIGDATITLTVVDHGTTVAVEGQTWPTNFALKAGSTNTYHAVIDKAVADSLGGSVVENGLYEARITAAAPGGVDRHWVQLLVAKRGFVT